MPSLYNSALSLLQKIEVDKAVSFSVLSRFWLLFAGPITAILIATFFSPELQGYHYTFASLLSLQVFAELGLGTVIIQFAAHEWSKLQIDKQGFISGDQIALERLRSIFRFSLKWYAIASALFVFGLAIGGSIFFSAKSDPNIVWFAPWLALCILTGANLTLTSAWSILEGCNQVAKAQYYRMIVNITTSIAVWLSVLGGLNLWTAAAWNLVSFICALVLFYKGYKNFFKSLFGVSNGSSKVDWLKEMLPLQWRIAVTWLCSYFIFSLFTIFIIVLIVLIPLSLLGVLVWQEAAQFYGEFTQNNGQDGILIRFEGPIVAGQMGMTWSIVAAVSAIAGAWPNTRVPYFGVLVAQKRFGELDRLFYKITKIATAVALLGAIGAWSVIYGLNIIEHRLATRLLPPLPSAIFLLAIVFHILSIPMFLYLRAHKKEPTMLVSVVSAILILIFNLVLGKKYGVTGMAAGYLFVNILIVPLVFIIWSRAKKSWHGNLEEQV